MKVEYLLLLLPGYFTFCYGQDSSRGTCNVDGQILNDGDTIKVDCNFCTCSNGELGCTEMACSTWECSDIPCDPLDCYNVYTIDGECCPRCGVDCRLVRCAAPPTDCVTEIPPGQCCHVCKNGGFKNPVSIKPVDPVTTGDSTITVTCQVTEEFTMYHPSDEYDFQIGDRIWHQPVGHDVDGNAFIQDEVTEPGPVDCQVMTLDKVYSASTTVYFVKGDSDPVLVAEGDHVEMECVKVTLAPDLMVVWLVNGTPIPDLKMSRFTVDTESGNLNWEEADIDDIQLSINCVVLSKAAYNIFHDVKTAVKQKSAHSFQREISVLQFRKQGRGGKILYEAEIYGNTGYTLQWSTDTGRLDTNTTTSNYSSITLPSTTVPDLAVSYNGMVRWNDTFKIISKVVPPRPKESNVGMIVGIVLGLIAAAVVVGVGILYFIKKHRNQGGQDPNRTKDPLVEVPNGDVTPVKKQEGGEEREEENEPLNELAG